jgi:hypothetical protein
MNFEAGGQARMGAPGSGVVPDSAASGLPGDRRGPVLGSLPPPSAETGSLATTPQAAGRGTGQLQRCPPMGCIVLKPDPD